MPGTGLSAKHPAAHAVLTAPLGGREVKKHALATQLEMIEGGLKPVQCGSRVCIHSHEPEVCNPAVLFSSRTLLEMQKLRPCPGLLNENRCKDPQVMPMHIRFKKHCIMEYTHTQVHSLYAYYQVVNIKDTNHSYITRTPYS